MTEFFKQVMENKKLDCIVEAPLGDIPKRQQYHSLPEQVKSFVWTCPHYKARLADRSTNETTGFVPCGVCAKCKEFSTHVK